MSFPRPFYRWRPHPWHGLSIGPNPPTVVHAYIEITPFDPVKYEIDKETGYLRVDRPQRTSSNPPALYGFIPRTYCGPRVGALMEGAKSGDGDPLDICVLSERPITRAEVIVNARVLGGLPMLDGGEADDKILAVLENDPLWAKVTEVDELPEVLVERLRHYFLTYKMRPVHDASKDGDSGSGTVSTLRPPVTLGATYGRAHAEHVIRTAMRDYEEEYGGD
ncbi:inorganic pyrophosphatase [Haliangium ochraceum]|uniref:inorganic diphosphatase n=1 Tax=Haliangium ochraceum (strain DSM 14365 / JCM 11303 / SMP-2) TaxID=502025 RepID=D0LNL1_HALO1|nr:inorganic pyrophosphatase [Haliangium ochraceum]ACY16916.1 Inorganic diphosphatase [Haliangium ochraceum DSM 14365]